MTTRILHEREWPRLAGTLLETVWPHLDPAKSRVLVVEEDGQIVGCCTLFEQWHLEAAWIAPAHRGKVSVGRALLKGTRQLLRALHVPNVSMMALSPSSARMVRRMGLAMAMPAEHFVVKVRTV